MLLPPPTAAAIQQYKRGGFSRSHCAGAIVGCISRRGDLYYCAGAIVGYIWRRGDFL